MAIAVLLLLAVLWAAVLIPPVLRSRSASRRGDSLGRPGLGFGALPRNPLSRQLGRSRSADVSTSMGFRGAGAGPPSGPGRVSRYTPPLMAAAGASTMTPIQRRRRDVLLVLLGAVVLTFLIALLAGSMLLWGVQLAADAALGGYVFLLVQMKQRNATRPPARPRRTAPVDAPERPVMPSAPLPPTPTLTGRRIEPYSFPRSEDTAAEHHKWFGDHEVEPARQAVSL